MKKTFLLLLTIMLAFGMALVSCGGDDEEGPTVYTVTFQSIDSTPLVSVKTPASGTLGDNYPTDETLGVPKDIGFVSDAQYKVFTGWRDQDGNGVHAWTPIRKNLTVSPTFYEIPADDTLTVGADRPQTVTIKLETDASASRIRGHKYFRLAQDGGLQSNHVYKVEADYAITSPTGFHFVSFTASLDQYGWHADWLNDLTKEGSVSISIPNKVPTDSTNPTAYLDDALHFFVDFGQDDAEAAASAGQEITVVFSKLIVTDDGPPPVVTFDVNGGDGTNVLIETTQGKLFNASELPILAKSEKVLKGWSTAATGTPQVDPTTIAVDGDTTYYAIWADQEWVTSLGTGNQIQNIPISTFADDAYIEVVYEGESSPGTTYGLGALCNSSWEGLISIYTPPTALTPVEGLITFKVRFLVSTVKAAVGDTLVINNWGETLPGVGANLVSFTAPPEIPEIPTDAVVLWQAGDGLEDWTLPEYQFTVTADTDGSLSFTLGEGTYASITLPLAAPMDISATPTVYAVVKGAGDKAMKYVCKSDATHGSENNTFQPTSADAWQTISAGNFWGLYGMEGEADYTAIIEFSIAFEQADYAWSLYALYLK